MEVPTGWSNRALKTLTHPRFARVDGEKREGKCQFPDGRLVSWEGQEVCSLWGYQGDWSAPARALLEAAGSLLEGLGWSRALDISPRELEAYLRDSNSRPAFPENAEAIFGADWKLIQKALGDWKNSGQVGGAYVFARKKSFRSMTVAEKITELKAFLHSEKLLPFFRQGGRLEVVDVEECTVYLALDAGHVPEGAFLDWLQLTAAEMFGEPTLNFIPEGLPSGPRLGPL